MPLQEFRSFVNEPTAADVSIALQNILLAPEGTAYTPGRVNVSSPPAGFIHLGAVAEDSPTVSVQRRVYRLSTGAPSVLRYQATQGIEGQVQGVLITNRNSRLFTSLGGIRMYHVPSTTGSAWAMVTSVVDRSTVHVTSVPMVSSITVGAMVVSDSTVAINQTFNEAFISSIATAGSGYVVTLANPHGFPILPVQSNPFFSVAMDRYALGTSQLPRFRLLGVADFFNGAQVVHDFQLATPTGQLAEQIRNGQEIRVPYSFDLFGYTVTSPFSSGGELIVGERIYFPPTNPGL